MKTWRNWITPEPHGSANGPVAERLLGLKDLLRLEAQFIVGERCADR